MKYESMQKHVRNLVPAAGILLILVALLAGFFPLTSHPVLAAGTTPLEASVYDLTSTKADTIVIGTAAETATYWNDAHTGIYTSVVLDVGEILKGTVNGDKITVTYKGGETEGMGMWSSDMPAFGTAEKAVLFLNKLPAGQIPVPGAEIEKLPEEQFSVYGGFKGKYEIINNTVGNIPLSDFKQMVSRVLTGQLSNLEEEKAQSSTTVMPYSFSGNSWPHPPNPVVHFKINENTSDTVEEGAAVQAAASAWNAAGSNYSFVYDGPSTATAYSVNGINEVMWGPLNAGTLAVTCVWYNPATRFIFETDMEFNDTYNWSTAVLTPKGYYDVQTIALHEMGHFLMLNDLYGAGDSAKVMYGVGIPGASKRTLTTDDIAGIQSIYGKSVAVPQVVNGIVTNITPESAALNGNVTSTGSESPAVHIYWGKTDGGTDPADWANDINLGLLSTGTFITAIAGLSAGTSYFFRSYAVNSAGGNWAPQTTAFTTNTFLTISINGKGISSPLAGSYLYPAESSIPILATPAANWTFKDWTGEVSNTADITTDVIMNANKAVTANFVRVSCRLTVLSNGIGDVTPTPGIYTYPTGAPVNIRVTPAPGWRFTGWSGDTGTVSDPEAVNTTLLLLGDCVITANFSPPELTQDVSAGGAAAETKHFAPAAEAGARPTGAIAPPTAQTSIVPSAEVPAVLNWALIITICGVCLPASILILYFTLRRKRP